MRLRTYTIPAIRAEIQRLQQHVGIAGDFDNEVWLKKAEVLAVLRRLENEPQGSSD